MGIWLSALAVSVLYLASWLLARKAHGRSHAVVLWTYLPALVISLITGASWGVVGHVMETEKADFATAFDYSMLIFAAGYGVVVLLYCGALAYVVRKRNTLIAG
ncbi:hypothetical protein PSGK_07545 [Pseudomonas solani]|uniref:hypothetical protein n=1 Tax=Pseudomonas solani TaxID=2731552 RepID=UPI0035BE6949